jgi:hypothetical protein
MEAKRPHTLFLAFLDHTTDHLDCWDEEAGCTSWDLERGDVFTLGPLRYQVDCPSQTAGGSLGLRTLVHGRSLPLIELFPIVE